VVYAICERSPSGRYLTRYIGSTSVPVDKRIKWHLATVRQVRQWNEDLAKLLANGFPSFKVLAIVPDDQRYAAEEMLTRRYRRHHKLVNVKNGTRHTVESIERIRAGKARARESRSLIGGI
jgi:hypothetical protein